MLLQQKIAKKLLLLTLMSLMLCISQPVVVFAEGDKKTESNEDVDDEDVDEDDEGDEGEGDSDSPANDLNDVKIEMGDDGGLTIDGISDGDGASTWNTIFNKSKVFVMGFSGIGTIAFIGFFIKNFIALGANSNNPSGRSQALTGCLWTGIAAAACGSVTLLVGLFWNAFK